MKKNKEYILYLTIIILIFVLDYVTKYFVKVNFDLHESITVIKNFFYLTYIHNTGAAFGILSGNKILLILFSFLVIFFIIYQFKSYKDSLLLKISFSSLLGGLLGNLFDRISYGYVVDFLDFRIFKYEFPVFNVSDIFIVLSVILIIFEISRYEGGEINENSSNKRRKG